MVSDLEEGEIDELSLVLVENCREGGGCQAGGCVGVL